MGDWRGEGGTDADGRCRDLTCDAATGIYRLTFQTGVYLRNQWPRQHLSGDFNRSSRAMERRIIICRFY